jgi:hypothetical protein
VLVRIPHHETDRASCGTSLEHATQQFHYVALLPGSCDTALSRATAIQFTLDEVQVDFNANGHTVHDTTDSLTVALSECRQREYVTKCVQLNFKL